MELFDAPRWAGGPKICIALNLPAFDSRKAVMEFHEKNAPGTHIERVGKCRVCGQWHMQSVAREPGGNSSGSGRYNKHKDDPVRIYRWEITLTPLDLDRATIDATNKLKDVDRKGQKDRFDPADWGSNRLQNEINSRLAEIAAAQLTGLPLNEYYGNERGADLGDRHQVRHTHHQTGVMIIRPGNEHRSHIYLLVIRSHPNYRLVGWLWGHEGLQEKYLNTRGKNTNWDIPQSDLHPMSTCPLE